MTRAKELISLGGAYFCTCGGGDFKVLKDSGKPCPHRDQSVEENLKEFDALINGVYRPGEAVLRAKTDLKARNPALRDFVLFRTQTKPHPLVGYKYSCWPLLDFQSAIDDHELDITHIIRGVDLMDSTRKQKLLYDIFGWEYPEVAYWGRVKIFDEDGTEIKFSSSEYAKGVKSGKYSGWDDPRLFTVRGMRAKGYLPQALLNWWLEFGLTQKNISVPMTTLNTLNRREMGAEDENPFGLSEEEKEALKESKRERHGTLIPPKSFKDWSHEEEFEHDHPNFSQWVREEVDEHGDPPMSIWGREEMMEKRHKDAEEDDDWDEDEESDADETYLPKTTTIVTALGLGAIAAYFAPAQIREFFKKLKN